MKLRLDGTGKISCPSLKTGRLAMEHCLAVGDLVVFNERDKPEWVDGVCLVIDVTKTKKTWHRFITLYFDGNTMRLPWVRKCMIEKV